MGGKTGSVTGMCYNPPAASSEKRLLVGPTNPPAGYVNSGKPCDDKYFCTILEGQPKGSVSIILGSYRKSKDNGLGMNV